LYIALMSFIFFYIKNKYSIGGVYDDPLFYCVFLGMLLINLLLWSPLNKFVSMVYTLIFSAYIIAQQIYHLAFHQYFRFATAFSLMNEVVGEGASAMEFVTFADVWPLVFIVFISILFIVLFFIFQRKCFKWWQKLIVSVLSLLIIFGIKANYDNFLARLEESKHSDQYDTFEANKLDYYIYDTIPSTNQVVEKFGLLTFAHRDAIALYENEEFSTENKDMVANFLANLPDHNDNEMTGIFKDKNVIFIQAESYNNCVLDPVLTPNIYKLAIEGINVKGFNTPSMPGSTSDTEVISNLSLIPYTEGYATSHKYATNTFPVGLPKLFNDMGYKTTGMHNNYAVYYNRNNMFSAYGYQKFMECIDFGMEDHQADSTIMEIYKWIPADSGIKTMDFWITYSGHQPYELGEVGVSDSDVQKIKSLYPNLSDDYVSYLAKNMDLDNAIGQLMSTLSQTGKLDDMVIVFFGDHQVKGLDFGPSASFYSATGKTYEDDDANTDLYIYNSQYAREHGPVVINKVSTCLDLLPTIANMWGVKYDAKKVMGRDIFDPSYTGFFFSDFQPWKTDNWEYNFETNSFSYINNISNEQAEKELEYYKQMKEVCRLIFKFDYFNENKDK